MSENAIDIVLRGKNETAAAFAGVKAELAGLFASTQADIDKLRGFALPLDAAKDSAAGVKGEMAGLDAIIPGLGSKIAAAFTVVGLVAFAKEAAQTILSLNAMREEDQQLEARFIGLGGGEAKATEGLRAMDAALGNAATQDEKMNAVARITALELTKTSAETAQLAKEALVLGAAGASAESKIDSLTQILVTGRTMGLAQYGIAVSAVNARAKELQDTTAGLSDIEAKQIAIKESLAEKMAAVTAAGGQAATATQRLGNAWKDLQMAAASKVNLDVVVNLITNLVRGATAEVSGENALPQQQAALASLTAQYDSLQLQIANAQKAGGGMTNAMTEGAERLKAAIAETQQRIFLLQAQTSEWGQGSMVAIGAVTSAVRELSPAELKAAQDATAVGVAVAGLRDKKTALDVAAVAAAILAGTLTDAELAAWGLAGALAHIQPQTVGDQGAYWSGVTGSTPPVTAESLAAYDKSAADSWLAFLKAKTDATEKDRLAGVDAAKDLATANKDAAKDAQSAWDKAFDAVANSAKSEFGTAQDQLKKLLPDMKFPGLGNNEPGSNGPFEGIFRAADVAAHGAASPWAAQLGLTQAAAKQIVADFAQGFRTPEVRKLIDEAMLIDQAAKAQAAADSLTAWGDEIAAKAGVSASLKAAGTAVTNAVFGGLGGAKTTGKDSAGPQSTNADAAVKAMLDGFVGSAQTQVNGKEFGKSMAEVGKSTFLLFEGGVVDAAKNSSSLAAVIDAMAAAAFARQSSAAAAARSNGIPPP